MQSLAISRSPKRLFFTLLAITTLLKLWLAAVIPFTSDEAYFYQWGTHPDWGGFYDHPPMAGWWLWALQQLSSHPLVLRLPAIALWIVIVFGMMDLHARLQPEHEQRRWLLGSLFLALPFTWALNLITTDTPLILFLFFSGYAFLRAERENDLRWHAAAGVLLGLALLSKYFAGLLAITYAVYLLPRRGGLKPLLVVALCSLPFMLLNLAWNSTHCWNNILFNLMNRNQGSHFSLENTGIYVGMMLYLLTPWSALALFRTGRWRGQWALLSMFVVPFVLFLLLSFYKTIGLHWVLAFLPFAFLFVAMHQDESQLARQRRWNLWLGLPHLIALLAIAYAPTDSFRSLKIHADVVMQRDGKAWVAALREDLLPGTVLMATSYSPAAVLSYHGGEHVPVFGTGSFHARFDDDITDFKALDGRDIRITSTRRLDAAAYAPYFDRVLVQEKHIDGATAWVVDGKGFRFQPYFERVIKPIAAKYYRVPSFLPLYGCQFLERYGFI